MKKLNVPPIWTILAILAAILLHRVLPFLPYRLGGFGFLQIILGVLLILWPAFLFKREKTTIIPRQKPTTLVVEGPFRISRNPMYLGMVLITFGVGLILGSVTAVIPAALLLWFLQKNYVLPEERKLREAMGQGAEDYFKATGRWIWFL